MPHPERGCSPDFKEQLLKMLHESSLSIDDKIQNLESVSDELDSIQNTLKFEGDS